MNNSLIVTHCLALLNQHQGLMTQSDKDFFDERVADVAENTDDLFISVLLLLTMRLALDLPEDQAEEAAFEMTSHHAQQYGTGLRA